MLQYVIRRIVLFFFFNDTATTEIYTLSLHDALPISKLEPDNLITRLRAQLADLENQIAQASVQLGDRKSTRLNSSHRCISYAVFCLKKKKKKKREDIANTIKKRAMIHTQEQIVHTRK